MPRGPTAAARDLLAGQIRAVERLRRETLGVDGSLGHSYFRALERDLNARPFPLSLDDVRDASDRADLVYVGDFHALPACQHFAADLLERLAASRATALAVEFVYTRQQAHLDRRQAGDLEDDELLRRIHYREEWGYPWEGFRALLDRARERGLPVFALDAPPRGGFEGLTRRDDHAARRIASILSADPSRRLVVVFGESHLARGHIPRRVRARMRARGRVPREVTVFQDPDPAYWRFVRRGDPLPPAARLGGGETYAVFHGSPLAKYEAYRQVLERWREDVPPDEEVDLTPAVHHLIGVLLDWLRIDPSRFRVRHRGGWEEDLADAMPEVYSGPEAASLLRPILEEHRRTRAEVEEARRRLASHGALYEPRSNTFFLTRYLPGRAAGEGARFLRAVLSGRLFAEAEETGAGPVGRAYGAAYTEALAYLGARLVDPAGDSPVAGERRPGRVRARWLEAHRRFEAGRRSSPPPAVIAPLLRSRGARRALARDLGLHLGRVLFERVRTGRLRRAGVRRLFAKRLAPGSACRSVLALLRQDQLEAKK